MRVCMHQPPEPTALVFRSRHGLSLHDRGTGCHCTVAVPTVEIRRETGAS